MRVCVWKKSCQQYLRLPSIWRIKTNKELDKYEQPVFGERKHYKDLC